MKGAFVGKKEFLLVTLYHVSEDAILQCVGFRSATCV